jgi:flavorubredoxin
LFDEGLMVKFTPHQETLRKCIEYGKAFGITLLENEQLRD